MSTSSVGTVRDAVAAAVAALSGWKQVPWSPGLFESVSDNLGHKGFAVGTPGSAPVSRENRQKRRVGTMLVATRIEIVWGWRIKGDGQLASYDAMLEAEQALVQAVRGITSVNVLVERLDRRPRPEGFLLNLSTFRAMHPYVIA